MGRVERSHTGAVEKKLMVGVVLMGSQECVVLALNKLMLGNVL